VHEACPASWLRCLPDSPDAANCLAPFCATKHFLGNHYSDPEVDELIAQQRGTEDPAEREALFVQIQDLVAEEISILPLLQGAQIAVSTSEVEGVTLDSSFKFRLSPISK